jgi:hypothetical protein
MDFKQDIRAIIFSSGLVEVQTARKLATIYTLIVAD